MRTYFNVFALAQYDNKYLIVQRAQSRNDPGEWNCVTGHVKDKETAEEGAIRELKEETNLDGIIIKSSEVFSKTIGDTRWVVVASLIKVESVKNFKLDKTESQNFKWIDRHDSIINRYEALSDTFKYLEIK